MFGRKKKNTGSPNGITNPKTLNKTSHRSLSCIYFEDVNNPYWKLEKVGRKGLNLMNLVKSNIPVPPFFVITTDVFDEFVYTAFQNKLPDLVKAGSIPDPLSIKRMFKRTTFLETIQKEIDSLYTRLSGLSPAWVSVRSSVVYDDQTINFSGVFDTILGVKGLENVLQAVKDVYFSVFTDKVIAFSRQNNIDLSKIRMAVVIQEMKPSEVSGEMYSVDPVLMDNKLLSIEAVYGLGSVITSGEITPDRYVINKVDGNIKEKVVAPQEWMLVQVLNNKSQVCNIDKVSISSQWSYVQKLEDFNVVELSKVGIAIEQIFGGIPQNITWTLSDGNFWILQSKPIKGVINSNNLANNKQVSNTATTMDTLVGVTADVKESIEKEIQNPALENATATHKQVKVLQNIESNLKSAEKLAELSHQKAFKEIKNEERKVSRKTDKLRDLDDNKFRLVTDAIGASYGSSIGRAVIFDKEVSEHSIDKSSILVIKDNIPAEEFAEFVLKANGVVMSGGSLTSDVSVMARETGIPIVVSAKETINNIKNGDILKIDGGSGGVYLYMEDDTFKNRLPNWVNTNSIIQNDEENLIKPTVKELTESDVPVTATNVYVYPSSLSNLKNVAKVIDGVIFVDLDKILLNQKEHILHAAETKSLRPFISKVASEIDNIADIVTPNEVVVTIGSASAKDFMHFENASKYESSVEVSGAKRYAMNPKMASSVFKIIRQLRNVFKDRNVSLGIVSPTNGDTMREIKLMLSSASLKRTRSFHLYAVITKSSEVLMIEDIAKVGIDGIIVNTPSLAIDMQDSPESYDLNSKGINITLKTIMDASKKISMPVTIVTEENLDLAKTAVSMGAVGICTTVENVLDVKKVIADQEASVILRVK